jgi:hypothetical protein
MWVYTDATNVVDAVTHLSSLTLGTPLPVSSGGTGVNTSLTAGSVVFAGASGVYSQDNANFFWDNTNDRLGIGTATPSQKLQVSGSSTSPIAISINNNDPGLSAGAKVSFAYSGAETGYVINQFDGVDFFNAYRANRGHYFLIGATEAMRVAADGNVGIGTSSPTSKLFVEGTIQARSGSTGVSFYGDGGAGYINGIGAFPLIFNTNGAERMRITSGGNVGIGVTSPSAKLDVDGSIIARTGGSVLTDSVAEYSGGGINLTVGTTGARDLILRTNNVERFRINSAGGITSADLADAVGYKGLPQNSQTSSYTLALADMGKHISITTGGVVIPANGTTAFPIGSTVVVFNNSGSSQTISITTDTLRLAGTATTGSRTLAQYGLATLVIVTSTVWVATGNVT